MKRLFVTVALAATILSSAFGSVYDTKRALEQKITTLVEILSARDTLFNDSIKTIDFYRFDINTHMKAISRTLSLTSDQASILFDVQDVVERELYSLSSIEDFSIREKRFGAIVQYWRRGAYIAFMTTDEVSEYEAHKYFRLYWAIVNATLHNRGFLNPAGEFTDGSCEFPKADSVKAIS